MLFFEIIGWLAIIFLTIALLAVLIFMAVTLVMLFCYLFLMACAYVKGGKGELMRQSERMKNLGK